MTDFSVLLRGCNGNPNPEIVAGIVAPLRVIGTNERGNVVAFYAASSKGAAAYIAESLRLCFEAESASFVTLREVDPERAAEPEGAPRRAAEDD